MKTNNVLRQFVMDGLVGVAVGLIIFVIIVLSFLSLVVDNRPSDFLVDFLKLLFFAPMPLVILTTFISVGFGGRFLETIISRKNWIRPILKISGISFLVGIGLFVMFFILGIILKLVAPVDFLVAIAILIWGGMGVMVGSFIASLSGVIFNPHKRIYRILIGATSSAFVACTMGFVIIASFIFR